METVLSSFALVAISEMGDKTQLATVALAARFHSVVLVTTGTTLGMLASDGLAVFLGEKLASRVPMRWIRMAAAGLFFALGGLSAWSAFFGTPSLDKGLHGLAVAMDNASARR